MSTIRVSPIVGRAISAEDDVVPNGHPVAMISYGYWKRRFGLSPAVIRRELVRFRGLEQGKTWRVMRSLLAARARLRRLHR